MDDFKKKMDEKIKLYSNKQYLDGYIRNEFLTSDGDADIFLIIHEIDELFDSRTVRDQTDLVSDIYDFIEEKTSMLDSTIKIHLHILGISLSPKDQERVRHILKEHYAIELYKAQKRYNEYRNKILGLVVIGLLCFFSYLFMAYHMGSEFFLEVLGFLFSFSLWEALDCYIYSYSETKEERKAITQNLLLDVDFQTEEDANR